MTRTTFEVYADVIEICPEIFTRIIQRTNISNSMAKKIINLGLVERKLGPGPSDVLNTRDQVYWVYVTDRGKEFLYHFRAIQKLLRG